MKETTIGGFVMPREYRHIQQYEKELFKLEERGLTHRETGDKVTESRVYLSSKTFRIHQLLQQLFVFK